VQPTALLDGLLIATPKPPLTPRDPGTTPPPWSTFLTSRTRTGTGILATKTLTVADLGLGSRPYFGAALAD